MLVFSFEECCLHGETSLQDAACSQSAGEFETTHGYTTTSLYISTQLNIPVLEYTARSCQCAAQKSESSVFQWECQIFQSLLRQLSGNATDFCANLHECFN